MRAVTKLLGSLTDQTEIDKVRSERSKTDFLFNISTFMSH